ncbi:MAG: CRISPR-associated protein Cas5 [Gammaproteobacteria bacterium]|nr:MAG: CRISPR-associated protein Cas5 [Gammaproteobacteria bacterium]
MPRPMACYTEPAEVSSVSASYAIPAPSAAL